jgi:hypothetical protein
VSTPERTTELAPLTRSPWLVGGRVRDTSRPLALRIGANDIVELVDDRWNTFVAGGRIGALKPALDGAPFWSAVEGGHAASLYGRMLERARDRHAVVIDLTAVSASDRLRIALTVTPVADGAVDLSLRTVQTRRTVPLALFDPAAERTDEGIKSCSFCQRIFGFSWQEAEVGVRQLRIAPHGPQPQLQPAICDDCERAVYASCKASALGV